MLIVSTFVSTSPSPPFPTSAEVPPLPDLRVRRSALRLARPVHPFFLPSLTRSRFPSFRTASQDLQDHRSSDKRNTGPAEFLVPCYRLLPGQPRSMDGAVRHRVKTSRQSSSSSSSSTPVRTVPSLGHLREGPLQQDIDRLRSLLDQLEGHDRSRDRRPSSKNSPASLGASRHPLPREERGGKVRPGHSRGEGTKRQ